MMRLLFFAILLHSSVFMSGQIGHSLEQFEGAIIRGDTVRKNIALVFTGDEYADGGEFIKGILEEDSIKASFFLTGNFYRDPGNASLIRTLKADGHYLGAHSDRHLLYCDWNNRDSLLVDYDEFSIDIDNNYRAMQHFGIEKEDAGYFLPPYEWYNKRISLWCSKKGLLLVNYTPGTMSHTDYTTPDMSNYRSSEDIYDSIIKYEMDSEHRLNGFILLIHIGSSPLRTDKFYYLLDDLIIELVKKGYNFCRIDNLLE